MDLKVSDIGEKGLIKEIISNSKNIIADDAAISHITENKDLISTCDMLIQSKHFPKEMSYYQMGFKSVTVNLSDLAAMGAEPFGFLLAIAIPKDLLFNDFKKIIRGVLDACDLYDIPLIGGDTNESNEIIISGTAFGLNSRNSSIMKHGFSKGDLVCITGDIGLAALGFTLLENDNFNERSKAPIEKALFPKAKIKEGIILKEIGATSLTDITDGLASELYEILDNNSSNGIMIYEDKLNISNDYKKITNYLDYILYVGEDFELLFTIPPYKKPILENMMDFRVIGEINDSNKIEITLSNGDIEEISSKGYDHFVG